MCTKYVRTNTDLGDTDISGVWKFEDCLGKAINITLQPDICELNISLDELKALVTELENYNNPKAAQNPPATNRD